MLGVTAINNRANARTTFAKLRLTTINDSANARTKFAKVRTSRNVRTPMGSRSGAELDEDANTLVALTARLMALHNDAKSHIALWAGQSSYAAMRNRSLSLDRRLPQVERIDALIRQQPPLPHDIHVFKGMHTGTFRLHTDSQPMQITSRKVWLLPMSTSADPDMAALFAIGYGYDDANQNEGGILLDIRVRKGQHVLYVDSFTKNIHGLKSGEFEKESEILLPSRGSILVSSVWYDPEIDLVVAKCTVAYK